MKKLTLFLCALCAGTVAFGQLKVQDDGKVVAYSSTTAPIGDAQVTVVTSNTDVGLNVKNTNDIATGIYGAAHSKPRWDSEKLIGVHGYVSNGSNTGITIGVKGVTQSDSGSGKNYGVYGAITPLNAFTLPNGAGILGYASQHMYPVLTARYAGYFVGDVNITTLLTVNTTTYTSDYRFKQNIASLNEKSTLNKLFELNPVSYNYKQRNIAAADSLGNAVEMPLYDEDSQLFKKKHYGLIAQEVRELYPDLVYEDGDGYLSVDYIGIIPLLISSVKDLKTEIDILKSNNTPVYQNNAPAKAPQQDILNETAALFQNTPNPFTENTEIAFYLPQSVTNAMLCVYDMNGKQLSQNVITQRGNSVFVVNGNEYGAGMYLYSLIADNQIIDTKRMILTK